MEPPISQENDGIDPHERDMAMMLTGLIQRPGYSDFTTVVLSDFRSLFDVRRVKCLTTRNAFSPRQNFDVTSDGYAGSIPFHFGKRAVSWMRMDSAFSLPRSTRPTTVYISRNTVSTLREQYVGGLRFKRGHWPMFNLRRKRLRSRQPPRRLGDPYIMAPLIALARAQRLGHKKQPKADQKSFKVCYAGSTLLYFFFRLRWAN